MQMNGMHVTPQWKAPVSLQSIEMPSGNFVDVSRHSKTTTTTSKTAKALGGRGRNAELHGVCVCVLQAAANLSPEPGFCTSTAAKFTLLACAPPCWAALAGRAQRCCQASHRDCCILLSHSAWPLPGAEVGMWGTDFSAHNLGVLTGKHTKLQHCRLGEMHTHLAALATLLAHWSGTHWKKFCASLNKTSHQHFMLAREKEPKVMYKRCTKNSRLLFLSLYLKLVLKYRAYF